MLVAPSALETLVAPLLAAVEGREGLSAQAPHAVQALPLSNSPHSLGPLGVGVLPRPLEGGKLSPSRVSQSKCKLSAQIASMRPHHPKQHRLALAARPHLLPQGQHRKDLPPCLACFWAWSL